MCPSIIGANAPDLYLANRLIESYDEFLSVLHGDKEGLANRLAEGLLLTKLDEWGRADLAHAMRAWAPMSVEATYVRICELLQAEPSVRRTHSAEQCDEAEPVVGDDRAADVELTDWKLPFSINDRDMCLRLRWLVDLDESVQAETGFALLTVYRGIHGQVPTISTQHGLGSAEDSLEKVVSMTVQAGFRGSVAKFKQTDGFCDPGKPLAQIRPGSSSDAEPFQGPDPEVSIEEIVNQLKKIHSLGWGSGSHEFEWRIPKAQADLADVARRGYRTAADLAFLLFLIGRELKLATMSGLPGLRELLEAAVQGGNRAAKEALRSAATVLNWRGSPELGKEPLATYKRLTSSAGNLKHNWLQPKWFSGIDLVACVTPEAEARPEAWLMKAAVEGNDEAIECLLHSLRSAV